MTFTTNLEIGVADGSSLHGVVDFTYEELVDTFGEPSSQGDGYKTDAEWEVRFDDRTVATIYNWKDGYNYCGEYGLDVQDISEWHIGGFDHRAVELVLEALGRGQA